MTRTHPLAPALALVLAAVLLLGACSGGAREQPEPSQPGSVAAPEPPGVRIGAPVWASRTSGLELPELVAVGEEVLVVEDLRGGGEGFSQVLDADSGDRLWRLPTRVEEDDLTGTDYILGGIEVGPDADGREIATVPYEQYSCRQAGDCTFRAGIEARDARTGKILWRWSSGADDADGLVLGAEVTPGAVLVPRGGAVVGLDPGTGERRWRADVNPPGLVEDGMGISGPVAGQDEPHRVLDLRTGRVVRSVEDARPPEGLVGSVLVRRDGDRLVLEDVRTGESFGALGESDVPPSPLASSGGLAWLTSDDRLLTLLPGETEPLSTPLPSEVDREAAFSGHFAGDVAGGVLVTMTDAGVRTMGREGGVDDRVGPRKGLIAGVAGGSLLLQVGMERNGADRPFQVRPIR